VSTEKVQRFSNSEMERQVGEVARLRILKGVDQGTVFVVKASSVILGRGDEADIRVADLKASRSHVRLDYTKEGWIVSDLGSANGVFFQGEYIRKFALRSGEHFTLGDTIFEFLVSGESTRMLTAPLRSGAEVEQLDHALSAQKLRVKAYSQAPKTAVTAAGAGAKKFNPRSLVLMAALGGLYFYMEMEEPAKAPAKPAVKKAEETDSRGLATYLPGGVAKEVSKTAEQYYRQGFREYREKNYLRAKAQFELSLQINPNHELARHYLHAAEQDILTEIKKMIYSAQKAVVAGRLKEAKGYYEAAMRLMYNDQTNPDFIECEEAVKKIVTELEGGNY
jgi:pSer/pThr/pTyr-binding forkhead associated (FHA) protein